MKFTVFKETKFILICQVILIIFLSILIGNLNSVKNDLIDRNKFRSENSIYLDFSNLDNNDFYTALNELKKIDYITLKYCNPMIFETQTESSDNIQGIYSKHNYDIDIPLKWGRLFTVDDLNNTEGLAIIGENLEKYTEKYNDKQYVISGSDKLEVIGVFKESKGFNNSDYIIYNLNSIIDKPHKLNKSAWVVDSSKYSQSELINIVTSIADVHISPSGIKYNDTTYIFILLSMIIAFLLTALTILMSLIRSIIMWINSITKELAIRVTSGASKKNIIKLTLNRYMQTVLLSSLISTVGIYFLIVCDIKIIYFYFNFRVIFTIFILSFLIGFIILLFLLNSLKSISISKLLKGRD